MWQEGGNSCLPRAWVPWNLYVHKASLQQQARACPGATSSGQRLPMEVGRAQRKQPAEKGASVASGGRLPDWREVASAMWPGRWPAGAATGSPLSTGEKMRNLKVTNSVLFRGLTEDYSVRDSLSDSSEELLRRDKGGGQEKTVVEHQKFTKNRHLQLIILALYYA